MAAISRGNLQQPLQTNLGAAATGKQPAPGKPEAEGEGIKAQVVTGHHIPEIDGVLLRLPIYCKQPRFVEWSPRSRGRGSVGVLQTPGGNCAAVLLRYVPVGPVGAQQVRLACTIALQSGSVYASASACCEFGAVTRACSTASSRPS